ncbi:cytochrome c oxidase assembly protein COX16-domain-containing protein [Glomus cerebriforme]|uniref:Cytochrome c oxidase assembly protein COX16, mitochondrial n=1 Tax=Glomus cerebriforme TaxID=658196 RepID=A0A397TF97_9GLOM|nr:cytochrome c oxidase assembly protein COX16-domain-containing protein [Glomus cerebriforme]
MRAFPRKRLNQPPIYRAIKKHPFLFFGLPLMVPIVGGSFALSYLTQTRYDLHENKTKRVGKEEELQMSKDRQQVDFQKEFKNLEATQDELDNWEIKRVERPPGAFDGILR